jgi:hypothetical protein
MNAFIAQSRSYRRMGAGEGGSLRGNRSASLLTPKQPPFRPPFRRRGETPATAGARGAMGSPNMYVQHTTARLPAPTARGRPRIVNS